MKKTVQIVTIPIDKKGFSKEDLCKCIKPLISGDTEGQMIIATHTATDENNPYWQAQQLLVLSDDEIKEGDVKHSRNCEPFKKVIASYPQIEGTLAISKETVQAWIDAGTPGDGSLEIKHKSTGRNTIGTTPAGEPIKMNSFIETSKLDSKGNLLLEFAQPFKSTMPIYTVPSIPTDEEIEGKAKEYAYEMKGQLYTEKGQHLANKAWSLLSRGYTDGYTQALKDLGYE